MDTSQRRWQITEKFWNVVLEKHADNRLAWSCEKWSIAQGQGGDENPTYHKKKPNWVGQTLHKNCLLKYAIEGKMEEKSDGKTQKKM